MCRSSELARAREPGQRPAGAEQRATLPPNVPLHARPAGALVLEASKFDACIEVRSNGKGANASSILELLALGATAGAELTVTASGKDAAEAVSHLAKFLAALGSGDDSPRQDDRLLG